jgi:hypothetical protein
MGVGSYHFAILGISVREFLDGFNFFKAAQVKEAFALLLKNGIIQPITIFRGEMRYVLADYELYFLIKNSQPISETDLAVNNIKENFGPPDYEEIEKRKLLFADEVSLKKSLDRRELNRDAFKKQTKKERGHKEFTRIEKEVKAELKKMEIDKINIINLIRETHKKCLEKYAFLSDVIGAVCPLLFQ